MLIKSQLTKRVTKQRPSNMMKSLKAFCETVLMAACLLPGLAQALPDIQEWQTANGVRVLLVEAHELPMVQVSMAFDGAASRDPENKSGLASIVNSMLSQGAGRGDQYRSADQLAEDIESIGAEFTQESARDMAIVGMRSLSEEAILSKATDLFALMVAEPSFESAVLQRELARAKVGLERQEQSPGGVVQRAFFAAMYPDHPYGRSPSNASLSAINSADAKAFHQQYYVAKNAVLVIVGDVNKQQAQSLAEKVSGGLAAGEEPLPIKAVDVPEPKQQQVSFDSLQSHIRMGFPSLKRGNPDYYPLLVGNYVLGGSGLIARLAVEVREKRGLSYSVYSYFNPMREKGPFIVGLQTRNDQRDQAIKVVRDTIQKFVEEGPSDEEIIKAKKHITGGFALRISSNSKIAGSLLSAAFYNRPLDYLDTYIATIDAITPEQVRATIKQYLDVEQLTQIVVGG